MYTPAHNAEHDPATLHQFLRENPLCALVTSTPSGLVASHIPMALHTEGAPVLRGHLARANNQWQHLTDQPEALGIFTGPQHYISASWYPEKATHGREVPTWNYVAVHVYGPIRAIDDPQGLLDHLHALTNANEHIAEIPWSVHDAPPEFISRLSRAIVGLELPITRIEGKWKASQNRNERDANAVTEALTRLDTPASLTMRDLIQSRRPPG